MSKKSFTLIELLVVIAIIGVLSSIVLVSLNAARAKARDARRNSDLKAIQTAMELYYDDKGYYPKEGDGANGRIGEGAGLDTMLAPYMSVPYDPLGPGDGSYYYYYDGNQWCIDGPYPNIAVIFARTMERADGNADDICPGGWGGEGGAGSAEAWHIYIGPSSDVY